MSEVIFSICHTTARPDGWQESYRAWIDRAAHPENVEYVLGSEGGKADYVHRFGKMESNGRKTELPKVGYDRLNEEILISGGGYTIPAEGIDG